MHPVSQSKAINPTALFSGEKCKEAPGKRTSLQLHTMQPRFTSGYVLFPLLRRICPTQTYALARAVIHVPF